MKEKEYTFIDYLIERERRERKYFQHYLKYSRQIKKEAEKLLGKIKVFIFGSILKKSLVSLFHQKEN